MKALSKFIKELRGYVHLSQADFAQRAGISCRQLQRLEKGTSTMTLPRLERMLTAFSLDLQIVRAEPDWAALADFGLMVNVPGGVPGRYSPAQAVAGLRAAVFFLLDKKHSRQWERHYDAFKALLIALQIYYPSSYKTLKNDTGIDLDSVFELNQVAGRHIKLYNMSLQAVSRYFKRERLSFTCWPE